MKIALTGGTGFLGRHITRELVSRGYDLVLIIRDSSDLHSIGGLMERVQYINIDRSQLALLFPEYNPDVIIHTATCYGRGGEDAEEISRCNVEFPLELLRLAQSHGVRTFLNSDTFFPEKYPPLPVYARTKKQFVRFGQRLSEKMECRFVNMRLEHVYGPGDDLVKFIPFVINSCLTGQERIPLTDCLQRRDLIYVSDVVTAYSVILEMIEEISFGFNEFGVGTGRSVPLREVVETIKALTGADTRLEFGALPQRAGELMDSAADTLALEGLGWRPEVALKEGLQRVVQSFQEEC